MRQVIQTQVRDTEERTQILTRLEELEAAKGTSSFIQKYQEFIASAANQISFIGHFIPALTQMLGYVVRGVTDAFCPAIVPQFVTN